MLNKLIVLLSALLYGMIEAFAFGHGLHIGPPDLLQTFVLSYHGPMAGLALIVCWKCGQLQMFPVWALLEDITFFIFSTNYALGPHSWVAAGLGGIHFTSQAFLPTTYLIMMASWILFEYSKPLIENKLKCQ